MNQNSKRNEWLWLIVVFISGVLVDSQMENTSYVGVHDSHEGSLRLPEPQYHLSEILEEKPLFPRHRPRPPVIPNFSYSQLYQIRVTTRRPSLSALPSMHESILLP